MPNGYAGEEEDDLGSSYSSEDAAGDWGEPEESFDPESGDSDVGPGPDSPDDGAPPGEEGGSGPPADDPTLDDITEPDPEPDPE